MTLEQEAAGMYFDACNQDVRDEQMEICCCGSGMNEHGWYDGHSPVSSWDWAKHCYIEEATK